MNKCYRIRFVSEKAQNIYNPVESDFLMHYGIKGQRWGVRRFQNPDGSYTDAGKKRYDRSIGDSNALSDSEKQKLASLAKESVVVKGLDYNNKKEIKKENKRLDKVESQIKNHPVIHDVASKVSDAYKQYKDIDDKLIKEENAFYQNKDLYEKYLNKAVDYFLKDAPDWSREEAYDWFKYDDGDQGDHSSIDLYKNSKEGRRLRSLENEASEYYVRYSRACKKYLSEYLGEYGDQIVNYGGWTRTVTQRLADNVMQIVESEGRKR